MRILLSAASFFGWPITKLDVKTAFLQIEQAYRDVCVIPPCESPDRGKYLWILLTVAYRLITANVKWKVQSDQFVTDIGFLQVPLIPQLFYIFNNSSVVAILSKIVDDFLIAGTSSIIYPIAQRIIEIFSLCTISKGLGMLRFFGLNILHNSYFTISVNGDNKLA